MKRRLVWAIFALLVVLSLVVPAFGEAKLDNVVDVAGLLTQDQKTALLGRAQELSDEYDLGIYIIAVQDYTRYSDQKEIHDGFIDIFAQNDLGRGEDRAAVSFFISMDTREFVFDFNSDRADYAFTEAGRDRLEDRVLPYLREGDWYGGFNEYLNVCQEYLQAAEAGHPVGDGEASRNEESGGFSILFFFPGIFAAAVTAVVLVSPMRSAREKRQADDYAVPGSMRLTRQSDHFVRRTVTRTPRPKQTSTPSSGGDTKTYSSGSHSGRSGKF